MISGLDSGCYHIPLQDPRSVKLSDLVFYNIEGNGVFSVSSSLIEAQRKCVDFLVERGIQVKTIKLDKLKKSLDIWSGLLNDAGGASFATLLSNGTNKSFWRELLIFLFSNSDHTLPAIALAVIEQISKLIPNKGVQLAAEFRRELVELLGDNGIILYPSFTGVAPLHHRPLIRPFDFLYTAIWNSMEVPSTQGNLKYSRFTIFSSFGLRFERIASWNSSDCFPWERPPNYCCCTRVGEEIRRLDS
jgi:fatty acid amide hydrolase 2